MAVTPLFSTFLFFGGYILDFKRKFIPLGYKPHFFPFMRLKKEDKAYKTVPKIYEPKPGPFSSFIQLHYTKKTYFSLLLAVPIKRLIWQYADSREKKYHIPGSVTLCAAKPFGFLTAVSPSER